MLCILWFVPVIYSLFVHCYSLFVYSYSLFIYSCSLFIIVVHLFCSCSISFICVRLLFFVHCSKEKRFNLILILDCIPGISILVINNCTRCSCSSTPSSMQVNKHHTAYCTDFVLVWEQRTYYDHRQSRIDRNQYSPRRHSSRGRDTYSEFYCCRADHRISGNVAKSNKTTSCL
jgi:hypothetical protein